MRQAKEVTVAEGPEHHSDHSATQQRRAEMKTLRSMGDVRRELHRVIEPAMDDKHHELWTRNYAEVIQAAFRPLKMSDPVIEYLVTMGPLWTARDVSRSLHDARSVAAAERQTAERVPNDANGDDALAAELSR